MRSGYVVCHLDQIYGRLQLPLLRVYTGYHGVQVPPQGNIGHVLRQPRLGEVYLVVVMLLILLGCVYLWDLLRFLFLRLLGWCVFLLKFLNNQISLGFLVRVNWLYGCL